MLYRGPADDPPTACMCAAEFYGMCLREAGCASEYVSITPTTHHDADFVGSPHSRMVECVEEHMKQDCADLSVCGSNCVGSGNSYDLSVISCRPPMTCTLACMRCVL